MASYPEISQDYINSNNYRDISYPCASASFRSNENGGIKAKIHPIFLTGMPAKQSNGDDFSVPIFDEKGFQVFMDVHQFKRDEVNVKVKGHRISVECEHEEREDRDGFIYRHFVRKFFLPKQCKTNDITQNVSNNGILCVTAPASSRVTSNKYVQKTENSGEKTTGAKKKISKPK